MMNAKQEVQQASEPRILRLLNGVLNGCEFTIESLRALVVINNSVPNDVLSPLNELPSDTLFLPINGGGENFELLFDDRSNEYLIRELLENGASERNAVSNTIQQVGNLEFSVKLQSDEWASVILKTEPLQPRRKKNFRATLSKNYVIFFIFSTACLLLALAVGMNIYNSESNYMRRLSQLLANRDLLFAEGRDHRLYVIAQDNRKAIWANQVVERGDFSTSRVKVVSPENEAQRIYYWLADNYPQLQYFKIQIGRSLSPILLISKQRTRLNEQDKINLKKRLIEFLPYVKNIDIVSIDDQSIIHDAEQGLQSLGLTYIKVQNENFNIFNIHGELSDNEIARLKLFINEFYRQWGMEFIVFNVALGSDSLHGKSYSVGNMEYIKNTPLQWDFINNKQ